MTTQEMLASATRAVKPWASLDATVYDLRTIRSSDTFTDQATIDICLKCPRAECCNCLDGWKSISAIRPHKKRGTRRAKV